MVRVRFIDAAGLARDIEAASGETLMEAAIANELAGIVGFCGGMCRCGTCHCYVDEPWASKLAPADENELDTLERVLERRAASRLGCQITLTPALDGVTVRLPARQRVP